MKILKKFYSLAPIIAILIIFSFSLACGSQSDGASSTKEKAQEEKESIPEETNVETSSQTSDSGKNAAIEEVKNSLTADVVGSYKAVKYENGYVVNFDDMAYWYVEDGIVWSLNGFAKTYAENTEYKYGIEWDDLF